MAEGFAMPVRMADAVARSGEMEWIETVPGMSWMKLLWTGAETGAWAQLIKWKKGYVAPPHKHLAAAHSFILSGSIQVRDRVLGAGDYLYEANGADHGATTALEDTEYLFISMGPAIGIDPESQAIRGYVDWHKLGLAAQAPGGGGA